MTCIIVGIGLSGLGLLAAACAAWAMGATFGEVGLEDGWQWGEPESWS